MGKKLTVCVHIGWAGLIGALAPAVVLGADGKDALRVVFPLPREMAIDFQELPEGLVAAGKPVPLAVPAAKSLAESALESSQPALGSLKVHVAVDWRALASDASPQPASDERGGQWLASLDPEGSGSRRLHLKPQHYGYEVSFGPRGDGIEDVRILPSVAALYQALAISRDSLRDAVPRMDMGYGRRAPANAAAAAGLAAQGAAPAPNLLSSGSPQAPKEISVTWPALPQGVSVEVAWWHSMTDMFYKRSGSDRGELIFNQDAWEATIAAYNAFLNIVHGTTSHWSDPENNGRWWGDWELTSLGVGQKDGYVLRGTNWKHTINPGISAGDITGVFAGRQFRMRYGPLRVEIEVGVGPLYGCLTGDSAIAPFPMLAAEGNGTIVYQLSPSFSFGYKTMNWYTGNTPTVYWSGMYFTFHQQF